jgi:hypothetical protein
MRLTILILAAFLVGCDRDTSKTSTQTEKPDTRPPFVLDPSKPFVIEFGRGSGLQGLDIVNAVGAMDRTVAIAKVDLF